MDLGVLVVLLGNWEFFFGMRGKVEIYRGI